METNSSQQTINLLGYSRLSCELTRRQLTFLEARKLFFKSVYSHAFLLDLSANIIMIYKQLPLSNYLDICFESELQSSNSDSTSTRQFTILLEKILIGISVSENITIQTIPLIREII